MCVAALWTLRQLEPAVLAQHAAAVAARISDRLFACACVAALETLGMLEPADRRGMPPFVTSTSHRLTSLETLGMRAGSFGIGERS